jgi:Glycine cleavage system P-protein
MKASVSPELSPHELLAGSGYGHVRDIAASKLAQNFHPRDYAWPQLSDQAVRRILHGFAAEVTPASRMLSFLGPTLAGAPRIAGGKLSAEQAGQIYEQCVQALTGMEAVHAGVEREHEAWVIALRLVMAARPGRRGVLVAETMCPRLRSRLRRLLPALGLEYEEIHSSDGALLPASLLSLVSDRTAAVLVASPNYFGCFEPMSELGQLAHQRGAMLGAVTDLLSIVVARSPADYRGNFCLADWQSLDPVAPAAGERRFLVAVPEHLRNLLPPATRAAEQAREEMGQRLAACDGATLEHQARLVWGHAHFLREALAQMPWCRFPHRQSYFRQFVVAVPGGAHSFVRELEDQGLLVGLPLLPYAYPSDWLLVRPSAEQTAADLDYLLKAARFGLARMAGQKLPADNS